MSALTSLKNPRIVSAVKLHDTRERRRTGLTLVEGRAFVADVAATGARVVEVFAGPDSPTVPGVEVTAVSLPILKKLAGTAHPQGPVAVVAIPEAGTVRTHDTVVLWDVGDPGNVGAMVRTAAAFGYDVAVIPGTADVWSPRVIRAAAGAQFHTRIAYVDAAAMLAVLRESELTVVATTATAGTPPTAPIDGPVAVLIGNEAAGLPADVVSAADEVVTIPLAGKVESLNAAVAAGIVLHSLAAAAS